MGLISFLNRPISRKAFMHLMRMRILPAGDVLNRFQQADKIPQFVLELVPRVVIEWRRSRPASCCEAGWDK
jgi:hypothetical protein